MLRSRPGGASPWPAWLDLVQGVSGLVLVLFMWAHMLLVSSILLGKDAMYYVARLFEGEPLFGKPYPVIVSLVAAFILLVFLLHALAAIRKMPASWREYRAFSVHAKTFRHADTSLWMLQVVTGLLLMFLCVAHLAQMLLHPGDIGPFASADRVWSGRWWVLYLVLLFAAELHGGIGIYRLALKWGWLDDRRGSDGRRRLARAKWLLTGFFVVLGLTTLAAYMKLGYEHRQDSGERYRPEQVTQSRLTANPARWDT